MVKFFLIFTIGLLPLVLWGSYFYLKNPRKEGGSDVLKVLLLGALSIIPVLLFHQWLLREVLVALERAFPLFRQPFFQATLELILIILFILAFVSLFALLTSLFRAFKRKDSEMAPKVTLYKKLYNLTPILAIFFVLLFLDGVFNLFARTSFLLSVSGTIILFAVVEEYFKYMINPFLVEKKIHSIGTAMVHALYVGLAFAFIENLLFFYVNREADNFESIVIYRSVFTTLLHIGASGILGYFYGLSLFSRSMIANYEIEKGKYPVPFWVKPFFKKETVFQSVSVSRGFFIAAFVHAMFNLLISSGFRILAALWVIGTAAFAVMLLRSKAAEVQYGLIGTTVMPEIDFEALRLKISVLKEMKLIQQARSA